MRGGYGFHPCNKYDAHITDDIDCLNVIKPKDLVFLGEGQNGIVLQLDQTFAVKITYSDPHIREMQISCQLDVLKPFTQAFIVTHGWLQCMGIPASWMDFLPTHNQEGKPINWEKYQSRKLVYIFMEKSSFRLQLPPGMTPSAGTGVVFWEYPRPSVLKSILFILLHGLYVARKMLQFSHNDIHDGQIMLFRRPDCDAPIVLDKRYTVPGRCNLIPKFIDFGASKIGKGKDDMSSDDVGQLGKLFYDINPGAFQDLIDSYEFDDASGSSRNDYKIIKRLMDSEFFSEYQRRSEDLGTMCTMCMSRANAQVEGTRIYLCHLCQ